ncbi:MAG: glycosyltransferase family 4 protein [Candidatus Helarchaeota archaeon]
MNICIVSSGSIYDLIPPIYGGGIQNYIFSISKCLVAKGHKIIVISGLSYSNLKQYEKIQGIEIYRIKKIRNKSLSTLSFSLNIIKILKEIIRKYKIQVIHTNSRVSTSIIRLFFPNMPIIFTEHNWDILIAPPGYNAPSIFYPLMLIFELMALKFSNSIVCLTKFSCAIIKNLLWEKNIKKKIHHIPNFIDLTLLNKYNKELEKKLGDKKFFIYIGRLEIEKNLFTLLRAFSYIIKEKPDLNLYIIGLGPLFNKLIKFKEELKLKNCKILGKITNKDKYTYLKNCKGLILPSFYEIMPTVLLEAFAFKKPVIASSIPANKSLINDNSTGYLFDPNNIEQLINILRNILNNESKSNIIGENGYKILKNKFILNTQIKNILQVYRNYARKK